MDDLVEVFQTVVNEAVEIQTDVVEAVEEILIDVVEAATEAVEGIRTDVVEAVGEIQIDVTLDEVVQVVIATMSVQMSVIEKLEESGQAMLTTEGHNPFVLDAIKARIETTEVNGRDSRSPLLGCA